MSHDAFRLLRRPLLLVSLTLLSLGIDAAAQGAEQTSPQGRTVSVEGIDLFYRELGNGPPLVLLHGFSATGELWEPFLSGLAESYRVIVPDLRGHGRSTNPSGAFTHRQAALDIFALLDHLGIREFRAIGYSSGGMTLLHMATQQPSRVQAMILAAAAQYFPEQARAAMTRGYPEAHLARMRTWHQGNEAQINALVEQFRGMASSYTDMNLTAPLLATITAPTLIIYGDRDPFFPIELAVEQYRSIPNAYLWVLPNVTHGLMFGVLGASRDLGDEFSRVALDFLEDSRPPR